MRALKDILQELDKPGRDPRGPIKIFEFDKNVRTINDLHEGMELPGIVGNITNSGAFVDIGIKENGLVHLSQLADRSVSDPNEIVCIHQHVRVRVLSVDTDRKRIALKLISRVITIAIIINTTHRMEPSKPNVPPLMILFR